MKTGYRSVCGRSGILFFIRKKNNECGELEFTTVSVSNNPVTYFDTISTVGVLLSNPISLSSATL